MPIGKAGAWKHRGGVTRTRPRRRGPRRQGAYTPPRSGFRLQTSSGGWASEAEEPLGHSRWSRQAGARTKPPAGRALAAPFGSAHPTRPIRPSVRMSAATCWELAAPAFAPERRWGSGGAGTEPNTNQPNTTQTPSANHSAPAPSLSYPHTEESTGRRAHTTAPRPCQYSSRRALAVCHGSGATTSTPIVSSRLASPLASFPSPATERHRTGRGDRWPAGPSAELLRARADLTRSFRWSKGSPPSLLLLSVLLAPAASQEAATVGFGAARLGKRG
jgi:hypothetical protein